jgi:stage II sporulation protein D
MEKSMLVRILLILLVIGPLSVPINAGWFDSITGYFTKPTSTKPPKIRVLIVHDQQGVVIEVKGKYKMYDPHTGSHISTRFVGKRKFMQAVRDGLKWGEEFPGLYQLLIVPDENTTTTIVDGIEYKGPIYVYDIGGTISVINEIPIEDFLSSTLAKKFHQLPEEMLAASVIVARTNAFYAAANPKNPYWAVDATQVNYQGFAVDDPKSDLKNALSDTRYMVMSLKTNNGSEINTFPAEWRTEATIANQPNVSKITFEQAIEMAKKGEHAAQILMKAFPGIKIELVHSPNE